MHHVLRHRSAVPGPEATNVWTLDEVDDRILTAIELPDYPAVCLALRVTAPSRRARARGEYGLVPVSEKGNTWCVEQGVYDPILPAMSLVLTDAPPRIAKELRRIAAPS